MKYIYLEQKVLLISRKYRGSKGTRKRLNFTPPETGRSLEYSFVEREWRPNVFSVP